MLSRIAGPACEWAKLLVATQQPCLYDPKQFCTLLKLAYLPYLYENSPEGLEVETDAMSEADWAASIDVMPMLELCLEVNEVMSDATLTLEVTSLSPM